MQKACCSERTSVRLKNCPGKPTRPVPADSEEEEEEEEERLRSSQCSAAGQFTCGSDGACWVEKDPVKDAAWEEGTCACAQVCGYRGDRPQLVHPDLQCGEGHPDVGADGEDWVRSWSPALSSITSIISLPHSSPHLHLALPPRLQTSTSPALLPIGGEPRVRRAALPEVEQDASLYTASSYSCQAGPSPEKLGLPSLLLHHLHPVLPRSRHPSWQPRGGGDGGTSDPARSDCSSTTCLLPFLRGALLPTAGAAGAPDQPPF